MVRAEPDDLTAADLGRARGRSRRRRSRDDDVSGAGRRPRAHPRSAAARGDVLESPRPRHLLGPRAAKRAGCRRGRRGGRDRVPEPAVATPASRAGLGRSPVSANLGAPARRRPGGASARPARCLQENAAPADGRRAHARCVSRRVAAALRLRGRSPSGASSRAATSSFATHRSSTGATSTRRGSTAASARTTVRPSPASRSSAMRSGAASRRA